MVLAFLLSLAPGLLAWLPARGWSSEGTSSLALALLPWLALAGLPRSRRNGSGSLAVVGAMLPALALAAGVDLTAGRAPEALWALGGWGVLLVLLLAAAADRGRGSLHGGLWLAGVPGTACLAYAHLGVGRLDLDSTAGVLLGASPLVWAVAAASRASSSVDPGVPWPFGALALGLVLLLASSIEGRGGGEEPDR